MVAERRIQPAFCGHGQRNFCGARCDSFLGELYQASDTHAVTNTAFRGRVSGDVRKIKIIRRSSVPDSTATWLNDWDHIIVICSLQVDDRWIPGKVKGSQHIGVVDDTEASRPMQKA